VVILTAFNIILTAVNITLISRVPRKLPMKYETKRYKPAYTKKKSPESSPKFRARAPSSTELYEREVFGDKDKNRIHGDS
jgi:hypothetical protein